MSLSAKSRALKAALTRASSLAGRSFRVEGELDDGNMLVNVNLGGSPNITIVIVAINITVINVEVFINNGQFYRDDSSCGNPPPPWAPANGWRRRCEGGGRSGGRGSRS
jgi:hypothetical protein